MCPITTERTYWPISGTAVCRRCLSSALTTLSFACQRLRIVCRSTTNFPLRVFAQLWLKPKKVKRLRLSFSPLPSVFFRISAKLNQTRLSGMQFQPKPFKPLHKLAQKPLPVTPVFKSDNEVVRKSHHNHISLRF